MILVSLDFYSFISEQMLICPHCVNGFFVFFVLQQTLNKTRILEYIGRLRLNFNNPRPIFYDMSVMDVVFATDILKRLQNYILLKPQVTRLLSLLLFNI